MARAAARCAMIALSLLAVSACGSDTTEPEPSANSIEIAPAAVNLSIGASAHLEAHVLDQNGHVIDNPMGQLVWSSDDTMRVTVDDDGLIQGVSPGAATITARLGTLSGHVQATVESPVFNLTGSEAVTASIPPTGGEIEVESGSGVTYTLEIPLGALLDTTEITVTPVGSIGSSPFEALLGAVSFAPDGLQLLTPATLTIDLPTAPPTGQTALIEFSDDGTEFGYVVGTIDGSTITFPVPHFSGRGGVRIDPNAIPRPTHTSAESNALQETADELNDAGTQGRPVDLQVLAFALGVWYIDDIRPGLAAAAQSAQAFRRAISAWRFWLRSIDIADVQSGVPGLQQLLSAEISEAEQFAAAAISAQIQRSNADCFARQNTVPTKDVFYLQYAAEVWGLVTAAPDLDRASVLDGLCPRVVYPMLNLPPEPLDDGQPVQLDVQTGVTFDMSGTGSIRTGPAWPLSMRMIKAGTTNDGVVIVAPDNQGEYSESITPDGSADVAIDFHTCMDVDVTPPDMLDFTDVCADMSISRAVGQSGPQVVYESDFSGGVGGPGWSPQTVAAAPGGEKYLGDFRNTPVTLTLNQLPDHAQVTIEFDLYVIGTWDGNNPTSTGGSKDTFTFTAGGQTLRNTSFSNEDEDTQAFPGDLPSADYPPRTGASGVNSLGYDDDTTYSLTFDLTHSASSVVFTFQSTTSSDDELFGIDNVRVIVQ